MRPAIAPLRRGVQVASFLLTAPWLVMGFLRCPFGVPFVSCASCPATNCRGLWLFPWALAALVLSQIALARSFCGWLCPLGFVLDVLGLPLARRGGRTAAPGRRSHAVLWLRLGALTAVVAAVFAYNLGDDRVYDYVVRSPRLTDLEAFRVATALGLWRYPVRLALLVAILLTGLLVARLWCRCLCPLGTLLGLARPLARRQLGREAELCRHCGACLRICPMGTEPGTADCISCYECADRCPVDTCTTQPARRRWPRPEPGPPVTPPETHHGGTSPAASDPNVGAAKECLSPIREPAQQELRPPGMERRAVGSDWRAKFLLSRFPWRAKLLLSRIPSPSCFH
ncbi:MAG: 4Fe-4S binding protein [Lentisphaeria bacterium]|nr:4Fe-4S binding protein [Lentisphaeria bacterium]